MTDIDHEGGPARRLGAAAARRLPAFAAAVVLTATVATVVQTQVNLAELQALGATVGLSARAATTFEDLARFGLVMAALSAAGLLPALTLGGLLRHRLPPRWHGLLFAAAGMAGLCGMFLALGQVTPMRALVSATRGTAGWWSVCAAGALGGLLHARLTSVATRTGPRHRPPAHTGGARALLRAPVLIPAGLLALFAVGFGVTMPRADPVPRHADPASYRVETVAAGLARPWSVAPLPDGRLLLTEMGGGLWAIAPDGTRRPIEHPAWPQLYVRGSVAGLLEVAPDPDFARNGQLWLTFSYGGPGANGTRLVRGVLDGDRLRDLRVLFSSTLKAGDGHHGGRVAFLPDGSVVLALGDGVDRRELAQDPTRHQGKTVRLDREGRPPADNPYRSAPGVLPEIYSLGHRNPQGIAHDAETGELWSTEHGARGGDELNRVRAGANYGWPLVTQGIDYSFARITPFETLPGYTDALLRWTPSIAPAGLAIYRATRFPGWDGSLLVPALKERALRRVVRTDGRITGQELLLAELGQRLRDVKVAPDGAVMVLTDGPDARLLRLTPAP